MEIINNKKYLCFKTKRYDINENSNDNKITGISLKFEDVDIIGRLL